MALVCLAEKPLCEKQAFQNGMDYFSIPIEDYCAPKIGQIIQFVNFIKCMHSEGKSTDVYCEVGLGRTGCMLACYHVAQGLKPIDAISLTRKNHYQSIDTDRQMQAIYDFGDFINNTNPEKVTGL